MQINYFKKMLFDNLNTFISSVWNRLSRGIKPLAIWLIFVLAMLGFYLIVQLFNPSIRLDPITGVLEIKSGLLQRNNIYTLLIDPHDWEYTGIDISAGEVLIVSTSGKTTTGLDVVTIEENAKKAYTYTQEVKERMEKEKIKEEVALKQIKSAKYKNYEYGSGYIYGWRWIGSEGYPRDEPYIYGKIPSRFDLDKTLISEEHPPGRLIGYPVKDNKCPKLGGKIEQKFVIDFGRDKKDQKLQKVEVPSSVDKGSKLCLAINDSSLPEWQYDNLGFLMVTIQKS